MDRIDAMKAFVTAIDEGSLAAAGRKLGRSPTAISRAIAFLESCVGAELLHRTTRTIRTSGAGEQYAATCRRVLADLEEAEMIAAGERSAPRGTLTLTAPAMPGEAALRPILDAFMDAFPDVSARLHLTDRCVKLIDEGVDVALRIAHLPDSASIAIRVGEVRRVVAAAPRYLARHPRIAKPSDLAAHQIIAVKSVWSRLCGISRRCLDLACRKRFTSLPGSSSTAFVRRLISAIAGAGVTRVFSCQAAEHVRAGELELVLANDEEPPVPVHVLAPTGRLAVPKARAFVDFAVPRLRSYFARLAIDATKTATHARHGNAVTEAQVMAAFGLSATQRGTGPGVRMRPDCGPAPPRGTGFPAVHSLTRGPPNRKALVTVA